MPENPINKSVKQAIENKQTDGSYGWDCPWCTFPHKSVGYSHDGTPDTVEKIDMRCHMCDGLVEVINDTPR